MCGIAGAVGALLPKDISACDVMSDGLRHRGPDDSGRWDWRIGESFGAILCHRRLSIIDLRSLAAEPMVSETTGTAIVFNGEIYNFQVLRTELEAAGKRFVTNGDTEVILHGYDVWGVDVFAKLRGMFALVIADPGKARVVMARDGYGIKPMYFSRFRGAEGRPALAFASEGRVLVDAGFARPKTDPLRVGQYLWNGFMPGPETIWTDVAEMPRGSYAVLDDSNPTPSFQRFWGISNSLQQTATIDAEEADQLLAETVRLHLVADVPKVVFLSGGVDSSAVAAAAALQGGDLHTLSVVFAEALADEREFAGAVAGAIGSTHHTVELTAADVIDNIESAGRGFDQPSFDGINSWFVSREAARLGFKVALSGAGGDELTGGYTSFQRAMRAESMSRLPGGKHGALLAGYIFSQVRPHSKAGQLGSAFGALERLYQTQYALFSAGTLRQLLADNAALPAWGLTEQRAAQLALEISPLSTLRGVTALESEMFLGDRLLRDMDSVSMAHSIEVRVPLVDTFLSDRLSGLDDQKRYWPIGEKQLLRRQSKDVLPNNFFSRPKRGFEFPMDSWMRGPLRPLVESKLLDPTQCAAVGLRADQVARIWKRFIDRPGAIYWNRPWALFSLVSWASLNGVTC
jgi:asparagine synthase (glutamine-hydrolysing)